MAEKQENAPPLPTNRLKQIANDACDSALNGAEFYDHSQTGQWNNTIINNMLRAVISEAMPDKSAAPTYKFAVSSTIVQHLVPTSQLNKSKGTSTGTSTEGDTTDAATSSDSTATATATDGKPHIGRRGMHSATGAFWNEATDGIWSYKYDGGAKGLDIVVVLLWIAI